MNQNLTEKQLNDIIIQIIKTKEPKDVKELVDILRKEFSVPQEKLLKSIVKLQAQGKIMLKKTPVFIPTKLTAYLKTAHAHWYWATILTAIITTAVIFAIPENFYPWVYARHILGAIFVLWLPGYTFIKALFPSESSEKAEEKGLDTIERIALSIGMSLALVPLIGLLLNYTPWGIRLTPIVFSLLALTVIFATIAIVRQYRTHTSLQL